MKKRIFLLSLLFCLFDVNIFAQNALFKAEISSGLIRGDRALLQTKDNGFFYAFVSDSNQLGFALLDSSGNFLWNRVSRYVENAGNMDISPAVELPGKQFLLTANSHHNLLRIDSVGNYMNAYKFSPIPSNIWIHTLQVFNDSNVLIQYVTNSGEFIAVADTSLNIIHSYHLDSLSDTLLSIQNAVYLNSGQILIHGAASYSPTGYHASWLMLCDMNFSTIWSRLINVNCSNSWLHSIQIRDNFIYTLAWCEQTSSGDNIISKINLTTGNVNWVKRFQRNAGEMMWLVKTQSDSLLVFFRGGHMMSVDSSGVLSQPFALPVYTDYIYDFNSMGGLVFPGNLRSNFTTKCIVRTDPTGHLPCFEVPDSNYISVVNNEPFTSMNFSATLIADTINIIPTQLLPDFFQYSFTTEDGCNYVGLSSIEKEAELSVYPNPAENIITIRLKSSSGNCSLKIFDRSGRLCLWDMYASNSQAISVSTKNLESGIYFLILENDEGKIYREKLVVIHH